MPKENLSASPAISTVLTNSLTTDKLTSQVLATTDHRKKKLKSLQSTCLVSIKIHPTPLAFKQRNYSVSVFADFGFVLSVWTLPKRQRSQTYPCSYLKFCSVWLLIIYHTISASLHHSLLVSPLSNRSFLCISPFPTCLEHIWGIQKSSTFSQ